MLIGLFDVNAEKLCEWIAQYVFYSVFFFDKWYSSRV